MEKLANNFYLIILISLSIIDQSKAAESSKCFFNDQCSCVEKTNNIFSEISCTNVTEFPEFKNLTKGLYSVEKLMISGEIKSMPQTGVDVFKRVNSMTIERTNGDEAFSIEGHGLYILKNCSLDTLTLIGFQEALPLSSASGYGLAIHPNTLAKLSSVDIEKSSMRFAKDSFFGAASLKSLALPNNNIADGAFRANDAFDPINDTLTELDLSNNKLETYQPSFQILKKLESFKLSVNDISNLSAAHFSQFPNLKLLALDQNKLSKFDVSVLFAGNASLLERLYLDSNQLTEIPLNAFTQLPHLKILSISRNFITNLTGSPFSSQTLQEINLDYNPIDELAPDALADLPSLKNFSVIGWNLETLDLGSFNGTGLNSLKIQNNNRLRKITYRFPARVPDDLSIIEISGNNLSALDVSLAKLFKNNSNLIITISNESNFDCDIDTDQSDTFSPTTNSTDNQSREEDRSLNWLANLAACELGNRVQIDESSVFCAPKQGQNVTESPVKFIDFLRTLDHNCTMATTVRPPKTSTDQPGSGSWRNSGLVIDSMILLIVGLFISLASQ